MEQVAQPNVAQPGGGFLVSPVPRGGIFVPEHVSEEQADFAEATKRFIDNEVRPNMEAIEEGATVEVDGETQPLVIKLLRDAADLGLTAIDLPEEYEGLGLDLTTSMLVARELSGCASFCTTLGAHAGIGTLPILYFGNEEQHARYLPRLATCEILSCYGLTEPGNGSDALHGRSHAVLSEDGSHYILNGQKQFITNSAWADIAVVFANIDGKYSGLIVDLHAEGVTRGAEEKKMGLHGSSTAGLTFEDVKVPAENLLGKVGDAAKIALNILYVGRMKLGFAALGTCKYAIDLTIPFMKERKQFGRPICEFDMQLAKIAEIASWTYGCDSACFRIAGDVTQLFDALPEGHSHLDEANVLRQFGLECALVKVSGTEVCSNVLYHAVRMHGGYGFCNEYIVERLARDNVVETIYEGTNDINRLVIAGAFVESAYMGSIPFGAFLDDVHAHLAGDLPEPEATGYLGAEVQRVERLKRGLAYAAEQGLLHTGKDIKNEQQVMAALADALIVIYTVESAVARTIAVGEEHTQAAVRGDVVRLLLGEAEDEVARCTRAIVDHVTPAPEQPRRRADLARLLPPTHQDRVALKRRVAQHVIAAGGYDLT